MIAYLDSSAFVKLVKREPESPALVAALGDWPDRASSWLLRVEVLRAARLSGADAFERAETMLRDVVLVPLTPAIFQRAAMLEPDGLRTLDALHVATALSLEDDLGLLVTYDERMRAAAAAVSLETLSPR